MRRKITLDQVKRELRARACQYCSLRTTGRPGQRIDTDRALECEATCELFTHLPMLKELAQQLDPMLRSYDTVLRHNINQMIESAIHSRAADEGRPSPLRRHRECVIQTLSELADQ